MSNNGTICFEECARCETHNFRSLEVCCMFIMLQSLDAERVAEDAQMK